MSYRPWPPTAYHPYRKIEASQETISDFAAFCLDEDNRRFKEIPVALTPLIKDEAGKIRKYADQISDILPRRVGKYPKWYRIAIEVEELAANIEMLVKDEIGPALKINQMIVIWSCLEEIQELAIQIKKTLKQIPRPLKPGAVIDLSIWEDAITEALKE